MRRSAKRVLQLKRKIGHRPLRRTQASPAIADSKQPLIYI
jgi:hypothetical protein